MCSTPPNSTCGGGPGSSPASAFSFLDMPMLLRSLRVMPPRPPASRLLCQSAHCGRSDFPSSKLCRAGSSRHLSSASLPPRSGSWPPWVAGASGRPSLCCPSLQGQPCPTSRTCVPSPAARSPRELRTQVLSGGPAAPQEQLCPSMYCSGQGVQPALADKLLQAQLQECACWTESHYRAAGGSGAIAGRSSCC